MAIGVRRVLSRENIYTIKLVGRHHLIPKALHANMFLVRHANEIMDKNVVVPDGAVVGVDKEHDRARGFVVSPGGVTVVGKGQVVTP